MFLLLSCAIGCEQKIERNYIGQSRTQIIESLKDEKGENIYKKDKILIGTRNGDSFFDNIEDIKKNIFLCLLLSGG